MSGPQTHAAAAQPPSRPQHQFNSAPSSSIVTGPNGQRIIVGPDAAASLLQQGGGDTFSPHAMPPTQQQHSGGIKRLAPTMSEIDSEPLQYPFPKRAAVGTEAGVTPAVVQSRTAPAQKRKEKRSKAAASKAGGEFDVLSAADLSAMTPSERRRYERNMREQQRSHKISEQIKELREVLTESKIPFKSNKFSILLSVAEYIKQLQSRAVLLDQEHQRLVDTLRATKEMVDEGRVPGEEERASSNDNAARSGSKNGTEGVSPDNLRSTPTFGDQDDMLFVQGIPYKGVFAQCSAALGVASLDGRFVACNAEFEVVSGYSREELARQSLFSLLTSENMQEVCEIMGGMLGDGTNADDSGGAEDGGKGSSSQQSYWSGNVLPKQRDSKVRNYVMYVLKCCQILRGCLVREKVLLSNAFHTSIFFTLSF